MLKKNICILLLVISFILSFKSKAFAQEQVKIILNEDEIQFSIPPVIEQDTPLVPIKDIFWAFETDVTWNESKKQIEATKQGKTIYLKPNNKKVNINGKEIQLDIPLKIVHGKTMIPITLVSKFFDAPLEFDQNNNQIVLNKTYNPDDLIQIDEFIKLIITTLKCDRNIVHMSDYWGSPYVKKAKKLGLLADFNNNFEEYNQPITRLQAAQIIAYTLDMRGSDISFETYSYDPTIENIKDVNKIPFRNLATVFTSCKYDFLSLDQNGNFNPYGTITREETLKIAQKLSKKQLEILELLKNKDGRKIRTTNLPKNYKDFPYILEDIPNEMYEFGLDQKATYFTENRPLTPFETLYEWGEWGISDTNFNRCNKLVIDNLTLRLNVDYETIDNKYATKLSETYGCFDQLDYIKTYIAWVKENHIKIIGECKTEPSIVYEDDGLYIRAYVKFKILSFDKNKDILYESYCPTDLKKNVWYEGYADIRLATNHVLLDGEKWRTHYDSYSISNDSILRTRSLNNGIKPVK